MKNDLSADALDFLIVGGGIAGLSAAYHLRQQGADVRVVDRARGVGGRCASREVSGSLVDHGVGFLHASHPSLMHACAPLMAQMRPWPQRWVGDLAQLRPQAFLPGVGRWAFVAGINSLAGQLAAGLQVTCGAKVISIAPCARGFCASFEDGSSQHAAVLVVALAAEQTAGLLRPLAADWPELEKMGVAVHAIRSSACDALIAVYASAPQLPWDVYVPEDASALAMVANESSKRPHGARTALVYTSKTWAAGERKAPDKENSAGEMLREAGRYLGAWAAHPHVHHLHRWGLGQAPAGCVPAPAMHLQHPQGGHLALCGDFFEPAGGIEGAWLSGQRLAQRFRDGL